MRGMLELTERCRDPVELLSCRSGPRGWQAHIRRKLQKAFGDSLEALRGVRIRFQAATFWGRFDVCTRHPAQGHQQFRRHGSPDETLGDIKRPV